MTIPRGLLCLAALGLAVCPARGQLSESDIAALRAEGGAKGWTFTVGPNPATKVPLEQLCGLVEPPDWQRAARFDPCDPRAKLPDTFDWRTLGGCTPVRNQGGCGSCWAFGTVAPLECNILIRDGVSVNLSEQWLVSCNQDGWGCGGGWWAHAYHDLHAVRTDPCGGVGAVMESSFPYAASDLPCNCPYDHEYLIDGWAYIGSGAGVADTQAIKQAIVDHGPVSVAVYVNSAFHAYSGGVFNGCQSGVVNHAVALVGWDDNDSGGVWFLRNSWGSGWGEGGYMRIPYGCSRVGYAACYVDYAGTDTLTVEPKEGFVSNGEAGGPFMPACKTYTLANEGASPLSWTATWNAAWLGVTPAGGTLGSGASVPVELCLGPTSASLPTGVYETTVTFANQTSGASRTRHVTLRIGQPDHFTEMFATGNDLDYKAVTFTPDGSVSFYAACTEAIAGLPTEPSGGVALSLSDDDYKAVTLNGAQVSLYGTMASTFYVGSNGYITFGQGDTNMVETLADHFDAPRISALYDDLNPAAGGTVSWKQLPDRAAVTWQNVPEYGYTNTHTFQIELHYDGVIRMAWLQLDAIDGLAGLSAGGGVPPGFIASDLSAYGACLPPAPPGDFDGDGDVDMEDFGRFQACLTGSGQESANPDCRKARLDADADIDHDDLVIFVRCLTGADVPAALDCDR